MIRVFSRFPWLSWPERQTVETLNQTRNRAWSHEILTSTEGRKETFGIMALRRIYILVVWFIALCPSILHYFSVALIATRCGGAGQLKSYRITRRPILLTSVEELWFTWIELWTCEMLLASRLQVPSRLKEKRLVLGCCFRNYRRTVNP